MRTFLRSLGLCAVIFSALSVVAWTTTANGGPVVRTIQFTDDFSSGTLDHWQFPYPEDWTIGSDGGLHYLHMLRMRQALVPRRPVQFALLKGITTGSFTLQTKVRREGKSMLIVFNYVDDLHFYYAHLSADAGAKVDVHNGLFIVDGGPRRRIAGIEAAPVLPDKNWHQIRIQRNVQSGSIEVFADDDRTPKFSVIDSTFNCGQVGLGSFEETGDFTDLRLTSTDAGCKPGTGAMLRPASAH